MDRTRAAIVFNRKEGSSCNFVVQVDFAENYNNMNAGKDSEYSLEAFASHFIHFVHGSTIARPSSSSLLSDVRCQLLPEQCCTM